jgi:hypothetical protein
VKLSARARELAPKALSSPEALQDFAIELRKTVPQLDRVCWTAVADGRLEVREAAQEAAMQRVIGGKGVTVGAKGLGLARCAEEAKLESHADLSKTTEFDLKFMSRALGSSLHVPVKLGGQPGSINFWSTDKSAFPEAAVTLLEEATKLMNGAAEK